jgi:subtilisin family serine protease
MAEIKSRQRKINRLHRPAVQAKGPISIAAAASKESSSETEKLTCPVIYIHGIGAQNPAQQLRQDWDTALFGQAMPDTEMAYWADIRHPAGRGIGTRALRPADGALKSIEAQRFIAAMQKAIGPHIPKAVSRATMQTRIFGSFTGIGDALFDLFSKTFVHDTAAYFFDTAQRREMQQRLIDVLNRHPDEPVLLVAHSQGTIIAYDVLQKLAGRTSSGKALRISLFVTLGSPLGIDEIQSRLVQPLVVPEGVAAWANFVDLMDPVALDKGLKDEFHGKIKISDTLVHNSVGFNPHAALGYLATSQVQSKIYPIVGRNQLHYGSRVRKDVLADMRDMMAARELVGERIRDERHPVLIELRDVGGFGKSALKGLGNTKDSEKTKTMDVLREDLVGFLEKNVEDVKEARIDPLHRYVAARLTSRQIQRIETECDASVYCVWKNSRKRSLISRSADVVQVPAARSAYRANGEGVTWAVLDTGVQSDHPHFQPRDSKKQGNIVKVWDCTNPGKPAPLLKPNRPSTDAEGHGTHVCGIIAGAEPDGKETGKHYGLAPQADLHVYKVLGDDGSGDDGWIIKALDHIVELNNSAGGLVIHGVNLSLGGPFDPEVYGCGFSPICQELQRLWRMGVVVCVACGNEGVIDVSTPQGTQTMNTFLSIGDPANLDDCIAIGSVNADRPHSYGISYFSSRGPTADGRCKPDLVAPGEQIASCNARFAPNAEASYYIPLSGTSMATPHVSGLIAAFLSVRREFIGRPDEVKRILLANCIDLNRDRYLQGAGMPNLMKMLANT